ncbi:MAG: hypothetical protein U0798_15205 [Gemmataceae bacterium]
MSEPKAITVPDSTPLPTISRAGGAGPFLRCLPADCQRSVLVAGGCPRGAEPGRNGQDAHAPRKAAGLLPQVSGHPLPVRSFVRIRKWLTSTALVSWENKVVVKETELVPDRVKAENRTIYRFRNGSIVDVAGLDDPQRVMSSEYDFIYLQEAGVPNDDLMGRLRNNVMPYQQLTMDCNPGSSRHWLKLAIDKKLYEQY